MPDSSYQIEKRAGEVIFREGDPADCAYVIERGAVEVSVQRDEGAVVLGKLGPGEILGEMAVIDQHSRTATARVTRDCLLTRVVPQQIQQRIQHADPVVRSLLGVLLTRYRAELSLEQGLPVEGEAGLLSHSRGIDKIRFENELRRALTRDEVKVVYQPIRRLRGAATSGFEALVRWDHPVQGTISPEKLVALAEETDLIVPLSLYVFRKAVEAFTEFQPLGPPGIFVSVNVSPRHTMDSEFLNRAWDICTDAGGRPENIVLELTETILVDIEQLVTWVKLATAMGFRISVDDFGTGYASLEYLTRLQPSTVKIDQNFIRPLVEDWRHRAVMSHVLGMARELGVQVVAEGVATDEHLRVLVEMGCDLAQGYAVGRPLERARVADYLRAP